MTKRPRDVNEDEDDFIQLTRKYRPIWMETQVDWDGLIDDCWRVVIDYLPWRRRLLDVLPCCKSMRRRVLPLRNVEFSIHDSKLYDRLDTLRINALDLFKTTFASLRSFTLPNRYGSGYVSRVHICEWMHETQQTSLTTIFMYANISFFNSEYKFPNVTTLELLDGELGMRPGESWREIAGIFPNIQQLNDQSSDDTGKIELIARLPSLSALTINIGRISTYYVHFTRLTSLAMLRPYRHRHDRFECDELIELYRMKLTRLQSLIIDDDWWDERATWVLCSLPSLRHMVWTDWTAKMQYRVELAPETNSKRIYVLPLGLKPGVLPAGSF